MLILLSGTMGSGKSLLLTILALYNKTDLELVSNYTLSGLTYTKFDINNFINGRYDNCIILLDEAYQYIDSRSSMKEINKLFSYMLFQSRKKSIHLYLAVQLSGTIDLRFRSLVDLVIECQNQLDGFLYTAYRPQYPYEQASSFLPMDVAEKFFKYYDTNEVLLDKPDTISFMSNEKKLELVKKAAPMVIDDFYSHLESEGKKRTKITRYYVRIWVMKNNFDKSLESLLFDYCRTIT